MNLHKSILDYFEDDTADVKGPLAPNVMRVQEGVILAKNKKPIPLGQTAHCSWFLAKGIAI